MAPVCQGSASPLAESYRKPEEPRACCRFPRLHGADSWGTCVVLSMAGQLCACPLGVGHRTLSSWIPSALSPSLSPSLRSFLPFIFLPLRHKPQRAQARPGGEEACVSKSSELARCWIHCHMPVQLPLTGPLQASPDSCCKNEARRSDRRSAWQWWVRLEQGLRPGV